MLILCCNKY